MDTQLMILIVENDENSLETAVDVLCEEGYAAQGVRSGEDAVRAVREGPPPQLILAEVSPSEVSAPELFVRLRAIPSCSEARFVAITTAPVDAVPGAAAVLLKPLGLLALLDTVRRFCGPGAREGIELR